MYKARKRFAQKEQGPQARGQTLVEFALILPVLLFTLMGIMDFGRALFTYAQASNAVRQSLRYGVILGDVSGSPNYLDCEAIQNVSSRVYFASSYNTTVSYIKADGTASLPADGNCDVTGEVTDAQLENGDILNVRVDATVELVTPVLNSVFPNLPLSIQGQRTIVKDLTLGAAGVSDFDLDGLGDVWEDNHFGDLSQDGVGDPDGDTCDNECEETYGTDPNDWDTDGDLISDYDEIFVNGTDPLDVLDPGGADSDSDGLDDGWENHHFGDLSQDATGDPDGDTCDNLCEQTNGTDPNDSDTDGDGMPDGWEITYSPPLDPTSDDAAGDPDSDTYSNLSEYTNGTDPSDPADPPTADSDADGLIDSWEMTHFGDLSHGPATDEEPDGCDNLCEQTNGTDPNDSDSDGDGMPDGWEITYGLNPLVDDSGDDADGDSLANGQEYSVGTSPSNPDTDGDTHTDGDEVTNGTDPLDPNDPPPAAACMVSGTSDFTYATNILWWDITNDGSQDLQVREIHITWPDGASQLKTVEIIFWDEGAGDGKQPVWDEEDTSSPTDLVDDVSGNDFNLDLGGTMRDLAVGNTGQVMFSFEKHNVKAPGNTYTVTVGFVVASDPSQTCQATLTRTYGS